MVIGGLWCLWLLGDGGWNKEIQETLIIVLLIIIQYKSREAFNMVAAVHGSQKK